MREIVYQNDTPPRPVEENRENLQKNTKFVKKISGGLIFFFILDTISWFVVRIRVSRFLYIDSWF